MTQLTALVIVGLLAWPGVSADSARSASPPRPVTSSAAREISRLARSIGSEPRRPQPVQQPPRRKGWIARHPKLFGALIGFGVGCAAGASQVGGSEDTVVNALDEFACPVIGGIGAAAGAIVGSIVK
jgi:hypothetical protein